MRLGFVKHPSLALLGGITVLLGILPGTSFAQTTNAFDTAINYTNNWTNGANRGTGFGPWNITVVSSSNSYAGSFIGDPNSAGVSGFGTSAFGLYANPPNSGAYVSADRSFSNALAVGGTFELKWAVNYDTGGGNKGFNLYSGGPGTNELVNINQRNFPGDITCNGVNTMITYGSGPMTWRFTMVNSNTLRVSSTLRDGSTNVAFTTNIPVSAPPRSFRLYASEMLNDGADGDKRQPYFNDFRITTSTGDLTAPVLSLAPGVGTVVWAEQNTNSTGNTLTLSASDVLATDNAGSASVRVYPGTVSLANSGFTTLTYIGTDAAGNTASLRRLLAVGNATPGFWNLKTGALTLHTLSTNGPVEGEIYLDGFTAGDGAATGVQAWVGVNSTNNNPATWTNSAWVEANYSGEGGNNDVYQGILAGTNRAPGTYYFATRFRLGTNAANTNFFYGGIGSDGGNGRWGEVRTNPTVLPGGGTTNVSVTNGNGILTVEAGRLVTYTVDMGVYRKWGSFNPSNHSVQVRTGLDSPGYAERALTNLPGGDLYSGTFPIGGAPGSTHYYKYFWVGTNAENLDWEPYVGPTLNRPLILGANGSATNTGTNFFGDLAGRRNVKYSVDMSVQRFKGLFNPSSHSLQVRTGMNSPGYAERTLTNTSGDLYEGTFVIDGAEGSTNLFKFYVNGFGGLEWENGVAERSLELGATATNQIAATNFFNNLLESRKISFRVDMSEQVAKLNLNPSNDTVSMLIFTGGFGGGTMSRVPNSNQYAYDLFFDGSMANFPTNFTYKFFNNNPTAPNSGYEGGLDDRTLAPSEVTASNLSTTTLAATFVDVPFVRPNTTFDGWRGSNSPTPELLTQYAFGALTPTNPAGRANQPSGGVSSNKLVLTYYVRADAQNSNLVVPQAHTNLADAGGWTNSGITVSSPLETNNVGGVILVKRTASVPIDSTNRKFLRLKISE